MWEYLAVLFLGFWLGFAIFLYVSCYWVEEILDLPAVRDGVRTAERGPSASGAHARLKRLVNRVIEEAMALPALAHYAQQPTDEREEGLDARTYEDLLASAILNKVIERYQTESTGGRSGGASSGIHSASASPTPSVPSTSSVSPPHSPHTPPPLHDDDDDDQTDSEWEHQDFRGQEIVELPRRVPFPEFGGDIIHCSEGSSELNDHLLEDMSGSDLQAADGSWEENWLFQKKKVKALQSVPVPMLVPNPNKEYRAMIGDREADDTTDLSDALTDSEEEHEYKSDIGRALESKTLIGGKTPINQLVNIDSEDDEDVTNFKNINKNNTVETESTKDQDSSTEVQEVTAEFNSSNDSVVVDTDSGPLDKAEFAVGEIYRTNPNSMRHTADVDETDSNSLFGGKSLLSNSNKENNNSLYNHQTEKDYEETITKPVQRYADSLRRSGSINGNDESIENKDDADLDLGLIPGSIADRERKKWLKCVEMPNNPYSAEAIQKRLSNKSSSALFDSLTATKPTKDGKLTKEEDKKPKTDNIEKPISSTPKVLKDVLAEEVPQYTRYGRDYYINAAKRSNGARKTSRLSGASSLCSINRATSLDQFDMNEFNSPGNEIKQFESTSANKGKTNQQGIRSSSVLNNTIHKCKDIAIDYENVNDESSVFSAKPAFVKDDTDERFEDILRSVQEISQQEKLNRHSECTTLAETNAADESIISSSSLEDSIKIYNVPKGEIISTSRDSQWAAIEDTDLDNNDNIVIQDKPVKSENLVSCEHDTPALIRLNGKMENGSYKQAGPEKEIKLPSVKKLANKFFKIKENEDISIPMEKPRRRKFSNDYELEVVNKSDPKLLAKQHNYMHSLTARSISKEFREELKLSMATPYKLPAGTNDPENVIRECSRPGSPLPEPGTTKNNIAYFESLKF